MGFEWYGSKSKILFYKRIVDPFHDRFMEHDIPNSTEICQNEL